MYMHTSEYGGMRFDLQRRVVFGIDQRQLFGSTTTSRHVSPNDGCEIWPAHHTDCTTQRNRNPRQMKREWSLDWAWLPIEDRAASNTGAECRACDANTYQKECDRRKTSEPEGSDSVCE